MSKQIKVSDEVHQRLMGAKSDTETVSDLIARLLDDSGRLATAPIDEGDALVEQLDSSRPADTEIIDMSDWVDGDAPECCIDTIANNFKPGHVCPDWVRLGYTDKNGLRRQAWFNNRTGEYEFSDRWQKIKAEYMYQ